eukprot:1706932-Prymnesium_polylepis.1
MQATARGHAYRQQVLELRDNQRQEAVRKGEAASVIQHRDVEAKKQQRAAAKQDAAATRVQTILRGQQSRAHLAP